MIINREPAMISLAEEPNKGEIRFCARIKAYAANIEFHEFSTLKPKILLLGMKLFI